MRKHIMTWYQQDLIFVFGIIFAFCMGFLKGRERSDYAESIWVEFFEDNENRSPFVSKHPIESIPGAKVFEYKKVLTKTLNS